MSKVESMPNDKNSELGKENICICNVLCCTLAIQNIVYVKGKVSCFNSTGIQSLVNLKFGRSSPPCSNSQQTFIRSVVLSLCHLESERHLNI